MGRFLAHINTIHDQFLFATSSWNPLECNFLRKPGQKVLLEVAWVDWWRKRRWNYLHFVLRRFCSAHICFHQAEKFLDTRFLFHVSSHFSWFQSQLRFNMVQLRFFPMTGLFPHPFRLFSTGYAVKGRESASGTQSIYRSMTDNVVDIQFIQSDYRVKLCETCLQNIPNWRC